MISEALAPRARRIRMIVFDVDGVFTDGTIAIDGDGVETKVFHVRDGLGVKQLLRAGIEVAVISGRRSGAVDLRMRELGVTQVHQGIDDKASVFAALCSQLQVRPEDVAVVGDDLPDVTLFELAGLSIAPADAHPVVRALAEWVTESGGGRGAVREIADTLLDLRERR